LTNAQKKKERKRKPIIIQQGFRFKHPTSFLSFFFTKKKTHPLDNGGEPAPWVFMKKGLVACWGSSWVVRGRGNRRRGRGREEEEEVVVEAEER